MIDLQQFHDLIVKPSLLELGEKFYSPSAAQLLIGTALTESGLKYLKQLGGGPALGVYQMEPDTHADIWDNYLYFNYRLANNVSDLRHRPDRMVWDLKYATKMARVHYWRRPEPLPTQGDMLGFAHYWKDYYNTSIGKGTIDGFIEKATPVLEIEL